MSGNAARNALVGVLMSLIAVLLVASGFALRFATEPDAASMAAPAQRADPQVILDYDLIGEILDVLAEDFVEPDRVDMELLFEGAIQGVFDALGDPHSTYIDPATWALSRGDFTGAFQGIGATVAQQDEYVVIVRPIPGTPAERAGLRPGDQILQVDGEDARGWSVAKAVLRIRGPRGTSVELLVRHADDDTEERVSLVRDEILVASVGSRPPGGVLRDADGELATDIGYIDIRSVTQRTPDELEAAIREAVDAGAVGLILDVRGNSGGLLRETAQIADMFLDRGIILIQVDREGRELVFEAEASAWPGQITDLPIVVVQDQFSASAAELLAAALQENGRATVVGSPSFGKGTVNRARELSNGGAVYVSIARWLTPDRNLIEGSGVLPDIEVVLTADDIEQRRDIALFRAIDVLRSAAS